MFGRVGHEHIIQIRARGAWKMKVPRASPSHLSGSLAQKTQRVCFQDRAHLTLIMSHPAWEIPLQSLTEIEQLVCEQAMHIPMGMK